MKQTSLDAIRVALQSALAEVQAKPLPEEGQWEYKRDTNGNWGRSFVAKPSILGLFLSRDPILEQLAEKLGETLRVDYADHMKSIGIATMAGPLQPSSKINGLLHECHKRFGTFVPSPAQIDTLLVEVAGFFDRTEVAPVL